MPNLGVLVGGVERAVHLEVPRRVRDELEGLRVEEEQVLVCAVLFPRHVARALELQANEAVARQPVVTVAPVRREELLVRLVDLPGRNGEVGSHLASTLGAEVERPLHRDRRTFDGERATRSAGLRGPVRLSRPVDVAVRTRGRDRQPEAGDVLARVARAVSVELLVHHADERLFCLRHLSVKQLDDGGFACVLHLIFETGDDDAGVVLLPCELGLRDATLWSVAQAVETCVGTGGAVPAEHDWLDNLGTTVELDVPPLLNEPQKG